MIGVATHYTDHSPKVTAAIKRAKFENMRHAIMSIRKDASQSIKQRRDRDNPSAPGQPPHQHKPGFFKRAMWAHWEESEAIAGFRGSMVGQVAATHEHGGTEEGRDYPERPTMAPALARNVARFHQGWRASIG